MVTDFVSHGTATPEFPGSHDLVLLGAGGHARVLVDALNRTGKILSGVYLPAGANKATWIEEIASITSDAMLQQRFPPETSRLILGIGAVGDNRKRKQLFIHYRSLGYRFSSVYHPHHCRADDVQLGEGCQVMAGAILQTATSVEDNVIINTGARIDHECLIESHAHIAPGAVLSGAVHVGCGAHIGTGAVIIQGIQIGAGALVAAGATVITHVPAQTTVAGVPAKPITSKKQIGA